MHACMCAGREVEREKERNHLLLSLKCARVGEEGRRGSMGERRARRRVSRDGHCFRPAREVGERRTKKREKERKEVRKQRRENV